MELRCLRDVDGREVDFVVLENQRPLWFVECKWNDAASVAAAGTQDYVSDESICVCPAGAFFAALA